VKRAHSKSVTVVVTQWLDLEREREMSGLVSQRVGVFDSAPTHRLGPDGLVRHLWWCLSD